MPTDPSTENPPDRLQGGTVAPASRAAVAKEPLQARNALSETARKADGEGRRGPSLPPRTEHAQEPTIDRGDMPELTSDHPKGATPPVRQARLFEDTPRATARNEARSERAALVTRIEAALTERYLIKHAAVSMGHRPLGSVEYRFRGDSARLAFVESPFKLSTDTNNPSVARSMVDIAQLRNWRGLRVSGAEEFRRLVWLEASVRGIKAIGYEPTLADLEALKHAREGRQANRIEPIPVEASNKTAPPSQNSSARGGDRKTVLAAIDAVLVAKGVSELRRTAVLAAATEQLAQRARSGKVPRIKVYDKTAPSQAPRPAQVAAPELARGRDRAPPAHPR